MYVTATHVKPSTIAEKICLYVRNRRKLDLLAVQIYICRRVWAELLFVLKTAKGVAFEGFVHSSCSAEAFRVSNFFVLGGGWLQE
jgi:hypothetical protein